MSNPQEDAELLDKIIHFGNFPSLPKAKKLLKLIKQYGMYQTHVDRINIVTSKREVWGIRIAYEGRQIYGDIAGSEKEANEKLQAELTALKYKDTGSA